MPQIDRSVELWHFEDSEQHSILPLSIWRQRLSVNVLSAGCQPMWYSAKCKKYEKYKERFTVSLKTEIPSHCILEIDIVSFNVLSPFLKAKQMKKGKDTVTVTVKAKEVGKAEGMQSVLLLSEWDSVPLSCPTALRPLCIVIMISILCRFCSFVLTSKCHPTSPVTLSFLCWRPVL